MHIYKIHDRAGKEHKPAVKAFTYSAPLQMSAATCWGGLTGHTRNDDSSCIDETESTEHADDGQNEAEDLSQAFYVSNISSIATCDDDCTSS